jgi:Na+-transporting NADH:ubiquinone oxidoreductase subunit B/electron transport complex protein RnfD
MKIVENIFEKLKPLFGKGKKLERLYPLYEMFEGMMLSSTQKTKNAPFGRDPIDIKRYMFMVVFALLPAFLASVYFFGYRMLLMLLVSYGAGAVIEVTFAIIRKHEVNEGFLVSGFIFPLVLPINTPLWLVAVGIMFGITVGKEIFGGTGRNIFNPALIGRVFIALAYPAVMADAWQAPAPGIFGHLLNFSFQPMADAVSAATPLIVAKSGEMASIFDLFIGRVGGSAGETSALAIIIGGLFLMRVGIANWRIPLSILLTFTGLNVIVNMVSPGIANPVQFNLLAGGLLFGSFFMATDPVTGPITLKGKWAYGIIIGGIAFLIRSFSGYVEGVMFAIILGNVCAPLIDEIIIRTKMRKIANER